MPDGDMKKEDMNTGSGSRSSLLRRFLQRLRPSWPELADYLDYPLGIHCSSHPRYAPVIQEYINARPDYCRNCITTDGGVNVSILYVPLEAAPHHEYVQVTMFDYFLLDEGRYQMTIRPTENLRAFTWYRP